MAKRTSKCKKGQPEAEARKLEALKMRNAGNTYQEIGDALGVSRQRACVIVTDELMKIQSEATDKAAEVLTIELGRLDKAIKECMVILDNGEEDSKLKAMEKLVKLQDRRAKYLGLDAPKDMNLHVVQDPIKGLSDEELDAVIDGGGDGD